MSLIKPVRAIQLNKSHPLARGLAGCWLFNEGSGSQAGDLSGRGLNIPVVGGTPQWTSGNHGWAMYFNNSDNEFLELDVSPVTDIPCTMMMWLCPDDGTQGHTYYSLYIANSGVTNQAWAVLLNYDNNGEVSFITNISLPGRAVSTKCLTAGRWHQIVGVVAGTNDRRCYVDGANKGTNSSYIAVPSGLNRISIGRASDSTPGYYFPGKVGCVFIWNRVLTDSEIALLYREPYAMFDMAGRTKCLSFHVTEVPLSGSIIAQASLCGELTTTCKTEKLGKTWLLDVLNNGMTGNAFKLCTTLSMSWFWMRSDICGALYRGSSLEQIDFTHILKTAEPGAETISPPDFCEHENDSDYFYVLRRFNKSGQEEKTIKAAVKVSIDSIGDIKINHPNSIFTSSVEIIDGDKVQLSWFYCPLKQESRPECFKIYFDNASGNIDYENCIAVIEYTDQNHYCFVSSSLGEGTYLFAIKAVNSDGNENNSSEHIKIQISNSSPSSVEVIGTEVCE